MSKQSDLVPAPLRHYGNPVKMGLFLMAVSNELGLGSSMNYVGDIRKPTLNNVEKICNIHAEKDKKNMQK
jgi:hypothetical protein